MPRLLDKAPPGVTSRHCQAVQSGGCCASCLIPKVHGRARGGGGLEYYVCRISRRAFPGMLPLVCLEGLLSGSQYPWRLRSSIPCTLGVDHRCIRLLLTINLDPPPPTSSHHFMPSPCTVTPGDVFERLTTARGGGGLTPPPLDPQSDHSGKKRNLQRGKSDQAIFGTRTFGSQTSLPPLLIHPWLTPSPWLRFSVGSSPPCLSAHSDKAPGQLSRSLPCYHREHLVGPFLVHELLGPRPPPPSSRLIHPWRTHRTLSPGTIAPRHGPLDAVLACCSERALVRRA